MTEHRNNSDNPQALAAAKSAIAERLKEIAAALHDLNSVEHANGLEWAKDPLASQKVKNRFALLLTQIYHIKDLAKKAQKLACPQGNKVDCFIGASAAISLCRDVANTYKHGASGRNKRSATLEYSVPIFAQSGKKPTPSDKVVGYGFLILDHLGNLHYANAIIETAVAEWLGFLGREFSVQVDANLFPVKGRYLYRADIPKGLQDWAKKQVAKPNRP
jgi:hypothetical protein